MFIDSKPPVARLTGRTRIERSKCTHDNGKEIVSYEVEVTLPDEGLQRQCYYCLCWESGGVVDDCHLSRRTCIGVNR